MVSEPKEDTPSTSESKNFVDRYLAGRTEFSRIDDWFRSSAERFVFLHTVIEKVAEANGGTFCQAARALRILLESERDFPAWYRWTDDKSAGMPDPENGAKWGLSLLEHAETTGEPVRHPHPYYKENGYDLFTMPEPSVYRFLAYGSKLGFQVAEISAFLNRHALCGFETLQRDMVVETASTELLSKSRNGNKPSNQTGAPQRTVELNTNHEVREPSTKQGLPSGVIAQAFADLYWSFEKWQVNLRDPSGWLRPHQVKEGQRGNGGRQAIWDPVGIAKDLLGRRIRSDKVVGGPVEASLRELKRRFRDVSALAPWRTEWDEIDAILDDE